MTLAASQSRPAPSDGALPGLSIAFLCKRRYMSKDVVLDRYARLYELPRQLACLGHHVRAFCLSYREQEGEGQWRHPAAPGSLVWNSRRISPLVLPTLLTYPLALLAEMRRDPPDIIIAASDIPHIVWGAWLAKRLATPFMADLYDDFESFGQARIPGAVSALRRAVRGADLVTTTSAPLARFVERQYRPRGQVVSMPSTIDREIFRPVERELARASLGLPSGVPLVGTAGGLTRDKGIETLYRAWERLSGAHPEVRLVLAGPHAGDLSPPTGERVHLLGPLPHAQVATLFAALDVGAICIRDSAFGRHCFPQKAYEMLACGLAVAAADVGAMGELLRDHPECLYRPDDAGSLADCLRRQIERPSRPAIPIRDWAELVGEIEPLLRSVLTPAAALPN